MKFKVVVATLSTVFALALLMPLKEVYSAQLGKKTCSYTHRDGPIKGTLTGNREHLYYTEISDLLPCPTPDELVTHTIEDFQWDANEGDTQIFLGLTSGDIREKCEVTVTITTVIGGGEPVFGPL